ncbi:probable ATP-dependent RNA helicase DDX31 isoform X2 [Dermochelys coriacea]|uniref:probable ATP-dependent RNA helicase DDX31 isoform X2 n=1 Tax=Dermochelys coriacea TaxID=27794 RepID=UPI001CAA1885|nr:probable ATP-dependent RNA helicase DDX31 isoform X2 [Dermochelys coriacea]
MEADEGLILNVSSLPSPESHHSAGHKRFRKPLPGKDKWQPTALKRKLQWADEGTPSKQKHKLSVSPIKKCTKEANICVKGNLSSKSPLKKHSADRQNESLSSRPFIKTSCLFKNNPEIPEIHRGGVKQVQERVFTSDSFSQLDLHPHLVSTITTVLKMSSMTSVQKQTIPVLLKGKDALVRSQTGSGKTLAYGIPLVQSLQGMKSKIQRSDGPYALILVPTRELALQSFDIVQKLLKPFTWIVPGVLMGGEKRKSEKARTLDMGFEKDVTVILNTLNAESERRQNVLLSATLTEGVTRLADISLHDPVSIAIVDETWDRTTPEQEAMCSPARTVEEGFAIPEKLKQHVVVVPSKLRLVTLAAFILGKCKFEKRHKMIVFFSSCEQVEFHYKLLLKILLGGQEAEEPERLPLPCSHLKFLRLHGNMEQEERTAVFQEFLQCKTGILLCTDVAARGLDLPRVTWIVQYNAPASPAEYVHRIGRTARIGCHGNSLLVLTPSEAEYVNSLASHKINVSEMKMEDILSSLMKDDRFKGRQWGNKKSHGMNPQEVRERATVLQTEFENYVHSSEGTVRWAKKALQSFLRSYTTYPKTLKHIFHIKSLHLGHVAKSFGLRDAPQNLSTSMAASLGKKTKLKPKRPDLRRKTQGKRRLAEILRSEYSSGMDSGVSKVKRKKKHGKPGNQKTLS